MESKPSDLEIMESKPSDLEIMESKPSDLEMTNGVQTFRFGNI